MEKHALAHTGDGEVGVIEEQSRAEQSGVEQRSVCTLRRHRTGDETSVRGAEVDSGSCHRVKRLVCSITELRQIHT